MPGDVSQLGLAGGKEKLRVQGKHTALGSGGFWGTVWGRGSSSDPGSRLAFPLWFRGPEVPDASKALWATPSLNAGLLHTRMLQKPTKRTLRLEEEGRARGPSPRPLPLPPSGTSGKPPRRLAFPQRSGPCFCSCDMMALGRKRQMRGALLLPGAKKWPYLPIIPPEQASFCFPLMIC